MSVEAPAKLRDAIAVRTFFALLVGGAVLMLWLFAGFLNDFVIALVLMGLGRGLYRALARRLGGRRTLAGVLTCAIVALTVIGPITFLAVSLSTEAAGWLQGASESVTLDKLEGFLFGDGFLATRLRSVAGTLGFEYTPAALKAQVTGATGIIAGFIYAQANAILGNSLSFLFHFIMTLLMFFYLLTGGEQLRAWVLAMSPLPSDESSLLAEKFLSVGRATVLGNGVVSVAQGLIAGLAMTIAGVPSAILWGSFVVVAAFLPMVGNTIVTVPVTIYLFVEDRPITAIVFFAFISTVGFIFDNVVKTKLMGRDMAMHDLLIFFSVLAGIGTFGLLGVLYGPLVVALFLSLTDLYLAHYRSTLTDARQGPAPAVAPPSTDG